MRSTTLLSTLLIALSGVDVYAQCTDITVGTYDGTPVPGNANTPFATNTGANTRNGHRVQYLYPASELLNAGLCPGVISAVTLYALSTDYWPDGSEPCQQFVSCPDVKIDVRLGNTALADFGPYVVSQSTPLDVDWDAGTEVSTQLFQLAPVAMLVEAGPMHFPLANGGFNWTGGNLAIDISWQRAVPIGISPAVQLVEDLPYTATKWVQVTEGFNPSHGNTYNDDPLTVNATTGTTHTRPVTTFNSLDAMMVTTVGSIEATPDRAWIDPNTNELIVSLNAAVPGVRTIICSDALGRELARGTAAPGTRTRIAVPGDHQGLVLVSTPEAGAIRNLGKVMVLRP